jgi:hypothetical protein
VRLLRDPFPTLPSCPALLPGVPAHLPHQPPGQLPTFPETIGGGLPIVDSSAEPGGYLAGGVPMPPCSPRRGEHCCREGGRETVTCVSVFAVGRTSDGRCVACVSGVGIPPGASVRSGSGCYRVLGPIHATFLRRGSRLVGSDVQCALAVLYRSKIWSRGHLGRPGVSLGRPART